MYMQFIECVCVWGGDITELEKIGVMKFIKSLQFVQCVTTVYKVQQFNKHTHGSNTKMDKNKGLNNQTARVD